MVAWKKEEVDAARHYQEEKREATRLGLTVVIVHGSVEFCEATPIIGLPSRRVEGILVRTLDGPRPA